MNVCFVTPRFPFPITKGDTLRAYHQIRELSRTHRIHLIAESPDDVAASAFEEMSRYCTEVEVVHVPRVRSLLTLASAGAFSSVPLQVLYFRAPELTATLQRAVRRRPFDIIHAMTIRVAPAVFGSHGVPIVVDFMDSFAANVSTRRDAAGPLFKMLYDAEYKRVAAYEQAIARRADGGLVIASLDRDTIGRHDLAVIPNGVDLDGFAYSESARETHTLVFTGNMGYEPNIDAVTWFASACFPALRERYPSLRLQIAGARPARPVRALSAVDGIEVTGEVPSMKPYLAKATLAVCPIRCGSGMQNKLLEAMAAGAPVVTTEFANRPVGARPGIDVLTAADATEFVNAVSVLLDDPQRRIRQARAARAFVEATYTWAGHGLALAAEYRRALDARMERRKTA